MSCPHYCTHGGVCSLPSGHLGLHSASGTCSWPDAESISEEQADALFVTKVKGSDAFTQSTARMLYGDDFFQREETP